MELPAVVVLLLLALLVGAAFGAWCARPAPPVLVPPEPSEAPAPLVLSPLPPLPPGQLARFLGPAHAAAVALHDAQPPPDELAQVLAGLASDHYSLGVQELRQALVDESGLDAVLADHLATLAILALEARHGGSTSDPR